MSFTDIATAGVSDIRTNTSDLLLAISSLLHAARFTLPADGQGNGHPVFRAGSMMEGPDVLPGVLFSHAQHCRQPTEDSFVQPMRSLLVRVRDHLRRLESEREYYRQQATRKEDQLQQATAWRQVSRQRLADTQHHLEEVERELAQAQHHVKTLKEKETSVLEELIYLRRFVRSLPSAYAHGYASFEEARSEGRFQEVRTLLDLVPDRRFEEAFRDKIGIIRYKRRCTQFRELYHAELEKRERAHMELEDGWTFTADNRLASHTDRHPTDVASLSALSLAYSSASFLAEEQLVNSGISESAATLQYNTRNLQSFPSQLPFSSSSSADTYVNALIKQSSFRELLQSGRDKLLLLSKRLKVAQDNGLRALHGIVLHVMRKVFISLPEHSVVNTQIQKLFETNMAKLQHAHRELLFSLVGCANDLVIRLVEQERGTTPHSASVKATHDVACSACFSDSGNYKLVRMEEELKFQRQQRLAADAEARERMECAAAKREESRATALTILRQMAAISTMLHSAVKVLPPKSKESNAIPQVQEPFASSGLAVDDDDVLDDPRLNVKISDAASAMAASLQLLFYSAPDSNVSSLVKQEGNANDDQSSTNPREAQRGNRRAYGKSKLAVLSGLPTPKSYKPKKLCRTRKAVNANGGSRRTKSSTNAKGSTDTVPHESISADEVIAVRNSARASVSTKVAHSSSLCGERTSFTASSGSFLVSTLVAPRGDYKAPAGVLRDVSCFEENALSYPQQLLPKKQFGSRLAELQVDNDASTAQRAMPAPTAAKRLSVKKVDIMFDHH